jgi:hypothetical protein
MREVLNEGGLLRSRVFHHLPFDKLKILAKSVAGGQAAQRINANLDPGLIVFSTIGLVMVHLATVRFWAEIFESKPPDKEALRLHITSLLLNGLKRIESGSLCSSRPRGEEQVGMEERCPCQEE